MTLERKTHIQKRNIKAIIANWTSKIQISRKFKSSDIPLILLEYQTKLYMQFLTNRFKYI